MAPLPVSMVALEKVIWSGLQSIIAAAVVLPMILLVSAEPVSISVASWPMLIVTVLLPHSWPDTSGWSLARSSSPSRSA